MVDLESEVGGDAFLPPLPTFVPRRYQPGSLANWSGHLAFANDLIADLRPAMIVELGTHYGESYFGMCQSVLENGVDCVCYAVDHWLGEEHAGNYGEEVFTEVNDYNRRFYKSFSYLLRSAFDDALCQFSDDSIDILHIDGLHTYEAGRHDFESWFAKVKRGGIVLLHDVMVRHANFGIWKIWEELRAEFAETFAFHHSWGLGVMRKPGGERRYSKLFESLFAGNRAIHEQVRRHYILYSSYMERLLLKDGGAGEPSHPMAAKTGSQQTLCQLFLPKDGGYSESASLPLELPFGIWKTLEFELSLGVAGSIRIDPSDCPCVLEIRSVELLDASLGTVVWQAETASDLRSLPVSGTAMVLPQAARCLLLSYGSDPQLFLPELHHDGALRLSISLCAHADFELLAKALAAASISANGPAPKGTLVQMYALRDGKYSEADSVKVYAPSGQWNELSFELGPGSMQGPIRFDPADVECMVEISELEISDCLTGRVLLSWRGASELKKLKVMDSAMYVPVDDRCLLFCSGSDAKLQLSPAVDFGGAVLVKCSMKIDTEIKAAADLLKAAIANTSAASEAEILKSELRASQSYRLLLATQLSQSGTEKNALVREINEKQQAIVKARENIKHLEELLDETRRRAEEESRTFFQARTALAAEKDRLTALIRSVENSVSWRLTRPLRGAMRVIRGGGVSS